MQVTATGKYWRLKYRFARKEKLLALGVYPDVSLAAAREGRDAARRLLAAGQDPSDVRKANKAQAALDGENTFEVMAKQWMEHQAGRWTDDTRLAIKASLENHVYPTLGKRPIANLVTRDVIVVVKAVEASGARDMAGRVLQRIKSVFRYAVTHQKIKQNPMIDLIQSEILKPHRVRHRQALALEEIPVFLQRLEEYRGAPSTRYALKFLVLTATRNGETRGARWSEIDLKAGLWRVPKERMKMERDHVIPLSTQAIAVLNAMQPLSGDRDLIFPSPYYPSQSLSENTLNGALIRMGFGESTPHGFRTLFSTIANEDEHNPDAVERALSHVERNQVRGAYDRGIRLKQRVKLMQWWADYLDAAAAEPALAVELIQSAPDFLPASEGDS